MFRHVFERGLAGLIARWMLAGRSEAIFRSIDKSGALSAEELEKLRAETLAYLDHVRAEGAPYADVVVSALGGLRSMIPDVGTLARGAGHVALMAALKAVEQANQGKDGAASWPSAWPPSAWPPTSESPAAPASGDPPRPADAGPTVAAGADAEAGPSDAAESK